MSFHWLHWKAKSSLWALPVSNVRFTWWHFLISSYYFTGSNGCSLTAWKSKEFTRCSGSFKCKIHLVTFLYIFLLVDCFKWAPIDCIEKRRVHSELCQFQTGGVYHKIHLVTFLYIFLLIDCFKWALIDHIEKQRVHSELCQFQMKNSPGDISLYLPISWLFQMSSHWLHWKAKSSLCALAVSNVRFTWWHFFISSY